MIDYIQFPPAIRTIPVRIWNVSHPMIESRAPAAEYRLYSFPWVSLYEDGPRVFFHNKPWKNEDELHQLRKTNGSCLSFCHITLPVLNSFCPGHNYRELLDKNMTWPQIFWFTTFTDFKNSYEYHLKVGVSSRDRRFYEQEVDRLTALRDIEHPERVLEIEWSKQSI